jgi:hypothetical protein
MWWWPSMSRWCFCHMMMLWRRTHLPTATIGEDNPCFMWLLVYNPHLLTESNTVIQQCHPTLFVFVIGISPLFPGFRPPLACSSIACFAYFRRSHATSTQVILGKYSDTGSY